MYRGLGIHDLRDQAGLEAHAKMLFFVGLPFFTSAMMQKLSQLVLTGIARLATTKFIANWIFLSNCLSALQIGSQPLLIAALR
jgi:hypothetical protein